MTYVWTIGAMAPSFNDYKDWHWAKKERERDAFLAAAWPLLYERGNVCPRPLRAPIILRAVCIRPTRRRRDGDNLSMPLWKWSQDLLVVRGFLTDDTLDLVTAMPPSVVVEPTAKILTVITIEEAAAK